MKTLRDGLLGVLEELCGFNLIWMQLMHFSIDSTLKKYIKMERNLFPGHSSTAE